MTLSPLRKLSMRLASLCLDDRQWILSQLADNERHTITGLLAEIDDLGLLKDPSIGHAVLAEPIKSVDQVSDIKKHILLQLAANGHPAWAAIFLLNFDAVSREKLIENLPNDDNSVLQWLAKLSSSNVPPALVKAVQQLASQQVS